MHGLLTTHDVAAIVGVHPFTVAKWIDKGYLKAWRTAGGHRRVKTEDLRAYLLANNRPVPKELGEGATKIRLLVIDDERIALNAIARSFKPFAAEVELTVTDSPVDALLLLMDLKPDGVLIDINMPGLDGYEVCRRASQYPSLGNTVLVAMTALHRPDVVKTALAAGAVACLAKPFNAQDVLGLIRTRAVVAVTARRSAAHRRVHPTKSAEAR